MKVKSPRILGRGRNISILALGLGMACLSGLGKAQAVSEEVLPNETLSFIGEAEKTQDWDLYSSFGQRLANAARYNGSGRYSSSRCYEFVWADLRQVLGSHIESTTVPSQSAYQFGDWADRNPQELSSTFHLRKSNVYPEAAPLGSVIVWNPGQCGYSSRHGHIEIAVGGGQACSDFCAPIASACSLPRVYVPIESNTSSSSTSSSSTSSSCDLRALEICLRYKGGQPCYPRSGCKG